MLQPNEGSIKHCAAAAEVVQQPRQAQEAAEIVRLHHRQAQKRLSSPWCSMSSNNMHAAVALELKKLDSTGMGKGLLKLPA